MLHNLVTQLLILMLFHPSKWTLQKVMESNIAITSQSNIITVNIDKSRSN